MNFPFLFLIFSKIFIFSETFYKNNFKILLTIFFDKNLDFILKGFEKQISKFFIFLYLFISNILTLSIIIEKDEHKKVYNEFVNSLKEYTKIKFDQGNIFKKINELFLYFILI